MLRFVRNKKATLYCTFSGVSGPVDPDTVPQITIYYQGEVELGPADMKKISTGLWYYSFTVPDGFVPGNYVAVYTGVLEGQPFQVSESFEVILESEVEYPEIPEGYCSVEDVKLYLRGIDLDILGSNVDNDIATLIVVESRNVDRFCNQSFMKKRVVWNFHGTGTNKIVCPWRPLISVSDVELRVIPQISWYTFKRIRYINVHRQGIDVATLSEEDRDADLFVDASAGILCIPPRILYMEMMAIPFWNYTFLEVNRTYNVRATIEYGWNEIPYEVQHAVAKRVACQVMGQIGNAVSGGVSSKSIDGYSISYGKEPFGGRIETLKKEAEEVLKKFRILSI